MLYLYQETLYLNYASKWNVPSRNLSSDVRCSHASLLQRRWKRSRKSQSNWEPSPHSTVITAQRAWHVCLFSLKRCFMALFTWAVNFHKWVVTYIQGRSFAACFLECALAAFQIKPEILSISFPGSSLSGFPRTGFSAEQLHGKVTARRRLEWIFVVALNITLTEIIKI